MGTHILQRVFRGYRGILRGIGFLLALLASSAGFGLLISWPLWRFATGNPAVFSLSALAVLAAGVAYLCTRSALRGRARRGRHPLVSALLVMLWILLFAGGGYAVLVFAFHGMYLAALPVLAALLLGLGYVAYVLQGKKGPV